MPLRRIASTASLFVAAAVVSPAASPRATSPPVAARPSEMVGLYHISAPDQLRPSARLRPAATEVTFLRLYADGRSRLENVSVRDVGGSARAELAVAPAHRNAWEVRTPDVAGAAGRLDRLCVEWVGRVQCDRFERDGATGDVTLFADASVGSVKLRLERVR